MGLGAVDYRKLSDEDVAASARNGNAERGFTELVTRYQNPIIDFVYWTVGDSERAEELTLMTFARAHGILHYFDASKSFSTWLFSIANNLAKKELRDRSHNSLGFGLETITSHEVAARGLGLLSADQRIVLLLRERRHFSYDDIAIITDATQEAVKQQLDAARLAFTEHVQQYS